MMTKGTDVDKMDGLMAEIKSLEDALERAQGVVSVMEAKRDREGFERAERWAKKVEFMLKRKRDQVAKLERSKRTGFKSQMRSTASGRAVRV